MKDKMHERVDRLEEKVNKRFAKLRRLIDQGRIGGEEDRLWLDQFAQGDGLNIACGDFIIGEAEGVDTSLNKLAANYFVEGDSLGNHADDELDFIVTNYLEAFPNVLKVLGEWYRVLRRGGKVAIVCADADKYSAAMGPLSNPRRLNIFTPVTLRQYLERVGFIKVVCQDSPTGTSIRVTAIKP